MLKYQRLSLASAIKRPLPPKPAFDLTEEQIEKLKTYKDIALAVLTVMGTVGLAILAPNALRIFDLFEKKKGRPRLSYDQKQKKLVRTFYYLKTRSYVSFKRKGEDFEITLTKEGKKQIRKLEFDSLTIQKPKAWDKKFWLIAADIPTKTHRRGADAFRTKLREMNFYSLQRTLWLYPYDPRIEIEFVARTYEIAQFVTTMKVEQLDPEDRERLTKYFREIGVI